MTRRSKVASFSELGRKWWLLAWSPVEYVDLSSGCWSTLTELGLGSKWGVPRWKDVEAASLLRLSLWSYTASLPEHSICHSIFSSAQFSRSVVSDSLRPHESQHAGPPCPSPTLGVHWDSRPSSQWCHPAISSSVVPFSSCPQCLPASESLLFTQVFHLLSSFLLCCFFLNENCKTVFWTKFIPIISFFQPLNP